MRQKRNEKVPTGKKKFVWHSMALIMFRKYEHFFLILFFHDKFHLCRNLFAQNWMHKSCECVRMCRTKYFHRGKKNLRLSARPRFFSFYSFSYVSYCISATCKGCGSSRRIYFSFFSFHILFFPVNTRNGCNIKKNREKLHC